MESKVKVKLNLLPYFGITKDAHECLWLNEAQCSAWYTSDPMTWDDNLMKELFMLCQNNYDSGQGRIL